MAKGVDLPANSGGEIEFILDKPVPKSCLIDHVDVMRGGLIMHTHTPISAFHNQAQMNTQSNNQKKENFGSLKPLGNGFLRHPIE